MEAELPAPAEAQVYADGRVECRLTSDRARPVTLLVGGIGLILTLEEAKAIKAALTRVIA